MWCGVVWCGVMWCGVVSKNADLSSPSPFLCLLPLSALTFNPFILFFFSFQILSCMRDAESESTSSSSSPTFTLWLHVLSFLSTAYPLNKNGASKRTGAGAGHDSQGHLIVKGRLRVAEHVDIDLNNSQRAVNPKLLRLLLQREESWRLYISW